MRTNFEVNNIIEFIEYIISKNGIVFEIDPDIMELTNECKTSFLFMIVFNLFLILFFNH